MASEAHQFIAEVIANKMYAEGYEVISFEGHNQTETVKLRLPPKILRHRPDLIGIKKQSIAIGEAKTASDLGKRTREQLQDFTNNDLWPADIEHKVFFGIPTSIKEEFMRMVKRLGIDENNLLIIDVPDRLLYYENKDSYL
jgi:hypothetical protein